MSVRPELAALSIGDPPERWRALGFVVNDRDRIVVGDVELRLGDSGSGITGWTLRNVERDGDIDGLPTTVTTEPPDPAPAQPNGVVGVDHVVITTPDFDRTVAALDVRGLALRRTRQAGDRRQGFRRLGPAIMEIVEAPEATRPGFWGVTFMVADLRTLGDALATHVGDVRPAVQPGRHIATLARSAGLSMPVAFMDADGHR
jgi:hypothetical protein